MGALGCSDWVEGALIRGSAGDGRRASESLDQFRVTPALPMVRDRG